MGIDIGLLRELCGRTLQATELEGLGRKEEGKVRDSYVRGDRRTIVVTDRVSSFDVVVGTLPLKGQVLNQVAAFWFERTQDLAPNHLIAVPDPCASVVRECRPLPVEFVYRGYLTGSTKTSIWTAYERGERTYCGHRLPDGLARHERLPEPLLTPTTKAPKGGHDVPASRAELIEQGAIDEETFDHAAALCAKLFAEGQRFAETRGLILVDTKYEIGVDDAGDLVVIDEIHTPDSSRYWYREAYEQVTGLAFQPDTEDPLPRLRRNLGLEEAGG